MMAFYGYLCWFNEKLVSSYSVAGRVYSDDCSPRQCLIGSCFMNTCTPFSWAIRDICWDTL